MAKKPNLAKLFDKFTDFVCKVPQIFITMIDDKEKLESILELIESDEEDLTWIREMDYVFLVSVWLDSETLKELDYVIEDEENSIMTIVTNHVDRTIIYQIFKMTYYEEMSVSQLEEEIEMFVKQENYEMCATLNKLLKKKRLQEDGSKIKQKEKRTK